MMLSGCTLLATTIYLIAAYNSPLWTDELITIITVRRPFLEGIFQREDYSAPLYQLLLRILVWGDRPSEWVVRAPAILCAVISLPVVWWLARSLFGNSVARLVVPLVTLNGLFAHYAREGRPYSMFFLLSALSMASFWQLVHAGRKRDWLLYVGSTAALCYSHYYGLLCLPAQAVYAAGEVRFHKPSRRKGLLAFAAVGVVAVLVLPAVWLVWRYITSGIPAMSESWLRRPVFLHTILFWHVGELMGSPGFGPLCVYTFLVAFWQPAALYDPKAIKSVPSTIPGNWWERHRPALLCGLWIVFSLGVPVAISSVRPIYHVRYGLPVLMPVLLLQLAGLQRMRRLWTVVIIVLVLFINLPMIKGVLLGRLGFPQVIAWIQDNHDEGAPVFVTDWGYCDNWINPEQFGLRYYGLPQERIRLLPLKYPFGSGLRCPEQMRTDQRVIVVGHIGGAEIAEYLRAESRDYQVHAFDVLFLFDIEKPAGRTRSPLAGG